MAQCKKILDTGERCSNQAVPGSDYCTEHRPISFRSVPKPPAPEQPKPPKEPRQQKKQKQPPKSAAAPQWVARPSAVGEPPDFPGLSRDARNILVAARGLIWLGKKGAEDQRASFEDRLGRLLACLSQDMPLPDHVSVRMLQRGTGALVLLTPPQAGTADLSRHYDAAAAAAAFSGGLLYVGQERAFIQYRDERAPAGYDAKGVQPEPGDELYLVGTRGTHCVPAATLTEAPLRELLLRIAPVSEPGAELPHRVFALAAAPLYRMLARYLRDHHLQYRVAYLQPEAGGRSVLFDITPRQDARAGAQVPAFVLSYLQALPRCVVLTESWAEAGRRVLVEWRHRHPCQARHVAEAFPPESLVLFTAQAESPGLYISPAPVFFEGDDLTGVKVLSPSRVALSPAAGREGLDLSLPVRLTRDSGPLPSTAALILDAEEAGWMRRLLYRLPGEAFRAYRFCLGEGRAVLLSEDLPIEAIPFGEPLRRVQNTQLFIPLRSRFIPDLPLALLAKSLELDETFYTFLTPEFRLDVPRTAFAPLSHALVAEPGRPRTKIQLLPAPGLPELVWTPPAPTEPARAEPARAEPTRAEPTRAGPTPTIFRQTTAPPRPASQPSQPRAEANEQPGWFRRLQNVFTQQSPARRDAPPPPPASKPTPAGPPPEPVAVERFIEQRAAAYQEAGDYLSAALCYAMIEDKIKAAGCYEEAAKRLADRRRKDKPAASS